MNTQLIGRPETARTELVPVDNSAALMAAVARAASDPSVDVEKMERLFAMHERMAQRQAEREFAEAMAAAQAEMPVIAKDRTNTQTSSDYATLDAINKRITPIYTGHGFSLSFDTEDSPLAEHVRVACNVLHRGGHSKSYHYDNPMDSSGIGGKTNKTPTHARGSAVTYGKRYLTMMIFNLATGFDDDGNGVHVDEVTPNYADWLAALDERNTVAGLQAVKVELKQKFGDRIPGAIIDRYNTRLAAIKGASA